MPLLVSWPKCYLCLTKEEVFLCKVCNKFVCSSCSGYTDGEYCQHARPAASDKGKWGK